MSETGSARVPTCNGLILRRVRAVVALAWAALTTSCYTHRAHDPRQRRIPYQGEVRVSTLRGDVFMLRAAAVHGDTLIGDRMFCTSGWGYDEDWCKGVKRVPADSTRIAIPVADIEKVLTRSFSAGRTIPVVAGITTGLALVILLTIGMTQLYTY